MGSAWGGLKMSSVYVMNQTKLGDSIYMKIQTTFLRIFLTTEIIENIDFNITNQVITYKIIMIDNK